MSNNTPQLNPNWVTGFVDAEGCFSVNMSIRRDGRREIAPSFVIAQQYKDIEILYAQKNYFTVGRISIQKNEARQEIIGYNNAINHVIPHFNVYPQYTKKLADYILWKNIILIQNDQEHQTLDGFRKCVSFKASQNNGLNENLKKLFPNVTPAIRPIVHQPDLINQHWLSGFTAGDGSFKINISKSTSHYIGYQIQAVFNISQHSKDLEQLKKIKDTLNCGNIHSYSVAGDKNNPEKSTFVVTNFRDINLKIINHFIKYPLINRKQKEFVIWCEIIIMIQNKEHLTVEGLIKIRQMRVEMRLVS